MTHEDMQKFREAGGVIEEAADITKHIDVIWPLLEQTRKLHQGRRDLEDPVVADKRFFDELERNPFASRRLFLARIEGEIVGFALCFDSAKSLLFWQYGLNYEKTVPSAAYFNLYHAMIEHGLLRKLEVVEMLAGGYETKRRYGAIPSSTEYHFEITRPVARMVAPFVIQRFSSQEGTLFSLQEYD